jgi:acyl carrier protein
MDENIIYKIEILKLIESKYNIEIKDEEVENILTLKNLIELIKNKKQIMYENRHI